MSLPPGDADFCWEHSAVSQEEILTWIKHVDSPLRESMNV